mgnify:CR=1 FL=1
MKKLALAQELKENAYPGRGISQRYAVHSDALTCSAKHKIINNKISFLIHL